MRKSLFRFMVWGFSASGVPRPGLKQKEYDNRGHGRNKSLASWHTGSKRREGMDQGQNRTFQGMFMVTYFLQLDPPLLQFPELSNSPISYKLFTEKSVTLSEL